MNPHMAFVIDFKLACVRKQGESWSQDYDWWSRGGADLELAVKFLVSFASEWWIEGRASVW